MYQIDGDRHRPEQKNQAGETAGQEKARVHAEPELFV